ncbi:MAG: hypothetical protein ACE5IH_02435 [Thermodesulfobacteriota bacterium]
MEQFGTKLVRVRILPAFIIVVSFLSLNGCAGLQSKTVKLPRSTIVTPKIIDGFSSPESVIADPVGKRLFVSNVGEKLEPSTKDKDGFISELSLDGAVLTEKYLPKDGVLHAPKGMAIIGHTLFVTDIDRVVGFDMVTREKTFEIDLSSEETLFLNDLTVFDDTTLFVSATDVGKIYKILLDFPARFALLAENISGVNGLYFDRTSNNLYVVSFGEETNFNGELGVISFEDDRPKYQKLTEQVGGLDGVAILPDSRVVFSDWVAFDKTGLMRTYDLNTKELSIIDLSEEVRGPADFFYDERNNNLWLPKMLEGKILIEKIK